MMKPDIAAANVTRQLSRFRPRLCRRSQRHGYCAAGHRSLTGRAIPADSSCSAAVDVQPARFPHHADRRGQRRQPVRIEVNHRCPCINPNETSQVLARPRARAPVQLFLSGAEGEAGALVDARVAGFPLELSLVAPDAPIDAVGDQRRRGGRGPGRPTATTARSRGSRSSREGPDAADRRGLRPVAGAGPRADPRRRARRRAAAARHRRARNRRSRRSAASSPAHGQRPRPAHQQAGQRHQERRRGRRDRAPDPDRDPLRRERSEARARGLPDRPRRPVRRRRLPAWPAAAAVAWPTWSRPARGSTATCCARPPRRIRAG